jgi:hypothetical protein
MQQQMQINDILSMTSRLQNKFSSNNTSSCPCDQALSCLSELHCRTEPCLVGDSLSAPYEHGLPAGLALQGVVAQWRFQTAAVKRNRQVLVHEWARIGGWSQDSDIAARLVVAVITHNG